MGNTTTNKKKGKSGKPTAVKAVVKDELVPLVDGPEIFARMEKELLKAKDYIYLTAWLLHPDFSLKSQPLRQILESKAAKGVDVRILWCDLDVMMGHFGPAWDKVKAAAWETTEATKLIAKGIKVHVSKQPIEGMGMETLEDLASDILKYPVVIASHHQKSLVIDGRVAFCSGCDIVEHTKHSEKWHDASIMIRGRGVHGVEENFVNRWNEEAKGSKGFTELNVNPLARESAKCTTIRTIPGTYTPIREIEKGYLSAIRQAKKAIYLENQYLRDPDIGKALVEALGRNVDVTVILPKLPEEANLKHDTLDTIPARISVYSQYRILKALISQEPGAVSAHYATLKKLKTNLSQHLKILQPKVRARPYIHAKVMIVDEHLSIIGSANTNGRSMNGKADSEINIRVDDQPFASELRQKLDKSLGGKLGAYDEQAIDGDEQVSQINKKHIAAINSEIDKYANKAGGWAAYQGYPAWAPKAKWIRKQIREGVADASRWGVISALDVVLPGIQKALDASTSEEFRDYLTDSVLNLI